MTNPTIDEVVGKIKNKLEANVRDREDVQLEIAISVNQGGIRFMVIGEKKRYFSSRKDHLPSKSG